MYCNILHFFIFVFFLILFLCGKRESLASNILKKHNFNIMVDCSHHCPSGMNTITGAIVYRSRPLDL